MAKKTEEEKAAARAMSAKQAEKRKAKLAEENKKRDEERRLRTALHGHDLKVTFVCPKCEKKNSQTLDSIRVDYNTGYYDEVETYVSFSCDGCNQEYVID